MHRQEQSTQSECFDCGATVTAATDRAFVVSDEVALCFDCSIARGGRYDERRDSWLTSPRLDGIADERRPHP